MSFTSRVREVIQAQPATLYKATIRSVDTDTVSITIGSSTNLIRNVQVVGGTDSLWPGTEVSIIWIQDRPVVLSGINSSALTVPVTTTYNIETPGTLDVFTTNQATGNHTHALDASYAPGTNAKLLRTDAQGKLTLDKFISRLLGVNKDPTLPLDIDVGSFAGVVGKFFASHAYQLWLNFQNTLGNFNIGLNSDGSFGVSDAGNSSPTLKVDAQVAPGTILEIGADGIVRINGKKIVLGGDIQIDPGSPLLGSTLVYNGSVWVPGPIAAGNSFTPPDGLSREIIQYGETYTIPSGYAMVTDEIDTVGDMEVDGAIIMVDGSDTGGGSVIEEGQLEEVLSGQKLDDLGSPDDNTDLNATTSAHGLMPKLSGNPNQVMTGVGTWITASFNGFTWRGTYNGAVVYNAYDIVYYNGSTYVCILTTSGILPTNTAYFAPWALKGDTGPAGTNGTNGTNGATGATGATGPVGATWRGAYTAGTTYAVNDLVSYNGSSYICILTSTGNLPTNTTYFSPVALAATGGGGSIDMIGIQVFS